MFKFFGRFNKAQVDNELFKQNVQQQIQSDLRRQAEIREQNRKIQQVVTHKMENYSK